LRGTNPPHAHNYYLNALAESGIVGLASYIVFMAGAFIYMLRRIRDARLRGIRNIHPFADPLALALGGLGVMLAISVHNLFDNIFVHGMTAQLGLTLGLVEGAWIASNEDPEETPH
jgi:O-antigen ligase